MFVVGAGLLMLTPVDFDGNTFRRVVEIEDTTTDHLLALASEVRAAKSFPCPEFSRVAGGSGKILTTSKRHVGMLFTIGGVSHGPSLSFSFLQNQSKT